MIDPRYSRARSQFVRFTKTVARNVSSHWDNGISKIGLALVALVAFRLNESTSLAQEMRVYTIVKSISGEKGSGSDDADREVSRSLTLFHAGKVYDYVHQPKEITIYEPSLHRMTLVNERRSLKTEVAHDEIRHFLNLAEQEVAKQIDVSSEPWLRFQLKPDFSIEMDTSRSRLKLSDRDFRYEAEVVEPSSVAVVDSYLRFADTMAELNSVLHPHAPLPSPRKVLNSELRERRLLPLTVEFRSNMGRPVRLQAEHKWGWKLEPSDRQLLTQWERDISNPAIRAVPFRQYQHESLSHENSRKLALDSSKR
ncbi:MAG: hypothetical protein FJ267_10020 [Planctomycetes bacterium]|nr:hypothetical protein [Planctomycetota bacterium]